METSPGWLKVCPTLACLLFVAWIMASIERAVDWSPQQLPFGADIIAALGLMGAWLVGGVFLAMKIDDGLVRLWNAMSGRRA